MAKLDETVIERAAARLRLGELVAFPTETVYGLGANALMGEAVARIFELKGRPRLNPLIVHVCDTRSADALCHFPDAARTLADAFWPGALTLVLERKRDCAVCDLASAGLSTLGVRVPAHPVAQALLRAVDVPVAAPSANRSGHVSATRAAHVRADLASLGDGIVDGGVTPIGIESTVVAVGGAVRERELDEVTLLRAGAIETVAIEDVLGRSISRNTDAEGANASSPGQLASHYAPRANLRLNVIRPEKSEALIAFGPNVPAHDGPLLNLSRDGDLVEAAANLFAALRDLDATGAQTISVMPIPAHGLGEAINDRLLRAAAPRA